MAIVIGVPFAGEVVVRVGQAFEETSSAGS